MTATLKKLEDSRNEDQQEFGEQRNQKVSQIEADLMAITTQIESIMTSGTSDQLFKLQDLENSKDKLVIQLETIGDIPESAMTKALTNELENLRALRSQKRQEIVSAAEATHPEVVSRIKAIDRYTIKIQDSIINQNQKVAQLKISAL